jgi:hypothetical protein
MHSLKVLHLISVMDFNVINLQGNIYTGKGIDIFGVNNNALEIY